MWDEWTDAEGRHYINVDIRTDTRRTGATSDKMGRHVQERKTEVTNNQKPELME
jgi:hypothetical protein